MTKSIPSIISLAIIYLLFLQSVTAASGDGASGDDASKDDFSGDDFTNNLFTDLSPLLALLGDRVTMQFLSQSIGLSECIILATVPLGVITIFTSAVRVGGYPWAKAVIGRATENIATAELEIMSSTSNEVCELWNGKDIVRCMGSGRILELIYLMPSRGIPKNPVVRILEMQEASRYIQRSSPNDKKGIWDIMRTYLKFFGNTRDISQENLDIPSQLTNEVIIVANTRHPAPNISLNRCKNIGRGELYFTACLSLALQAGVIVYSGLIAQSSKTTPGFQKGGGAVGTYTYPLFTIGTVLLSIGMFICSHVVGRSTKEEIFTPVEGWRARLVWLQQKKTVGDQEFKSFALFTGEDQPGIITSSRVEQDQTATGRNTLFTLECMTTIGAFLGLIGLITQCVGSRGSHWSVPVASLAAILIMAAMRVWVRRRFTTPIIATPLAPGLELDWFADSFKDLQSAEWLRCATQPVTSTTDNDEPGLDAQDLDLVDARDVCAIRQRLAKLVGWRSSVSQEAIAAAEAIEATMTILAHSDDSLHAGSYHDSRFSWEYQVEHGEQQIKTPRLNITRHGHKWRANAAEIEAALSLRLFYVKSFEQKGSSAANDVHALSDVSDDEWLRIRGKAAKFGIRVLGHRTAPRLRQLSWWMPAIGPEILRIGDASGFDSASNGRPIDATGSVSAGSSSYEVVEIEDSRAFGFAQCLQQRTNGQRERGISCHQGLQLSKFRNLENSQWRFKISKEEMACGEDSHFEEMADCLMAISCHDSLELLYAKDLFSTFMWDIVKSLKRPIEGKTSIRARDDDGRDSWKRFSLHNTTISRLCHIIRGTGLYNAGEALTSIISPLCDQQKLPTAQCIIDLARSRADEFERQQNWSSACKVYLWLGARKDAFGVESYAYAEVVAMIVAFLNTTRHRTDQMNIEKISEDESPIQELGDSVQGVDGTLSNCLTLFSDFQDDSWRKLFAKDFETTSKYERSLFIQAEMFESALRSHVRPQGQKWAEEVLQTDVFHRTLLHYAAAFTYDAGSRVDPWGDPIGFQFPNDIQKSREFCSAIKSLIEAGIQIDSGDVRGWAPLHYACRAGHVSMVRLLVENGASRDVQALDGTAPIHVAAKGSHLRIIELLVEHEANIDITDGMGKTALHYAAFNGCEETVEFLCQHGRQELRDRWGRTALHVAALVGSATVIAPLKRVANWKDNDERTALQLASRYGHHSFVQQLLDLPGIEMNAPDNLDRMGRRRSY